MFSFDSIIVIIVLIFILVSLYDEIIGPAFTFVVGVVVLGIFQILTIDEILAGFSNEPMILVIMLLLVGDVIHKTGVINGFFEQRMYRARTPRGFLLKVITPMAGLSAFVNNTPLVAILIPFVQTWSQRLKQPASKLLIPLSIAIILGGNMTLIGTSNNLIANSLVKEQKIVEGFTSLHFLDFLWVGLPMFILGMIYLLLFSQKLLPNRREPISAIGGNQREYLVEARIQSQGQLVGQTIPESALLNLKGLSLLEVRSHRRDTIARIPSTDLFYQLSEGDILLFTGNTSAVSELIDTFKGIELLEVGQFLRNDQTEVIEVVVSHNSTLISKTVRECMFRRKYDAVVLGIHRNGEKIEEKTSNIKIKAGDAVLLLAGPGFNVRADETSDFYHLRRVRKIQRPGTLKSILVLGGLALVILLNVFGWIKLIMGVAVYLMVLLLTKTASPKEVVKSLDYNLGLIIAMTMALGTAMFNTGLADQFAMGIISIFEPVGLVGIMAGLYLVTMLLAAYVNNKAALTLIFPVALLTAVNLKVNPTMFILLITSASMGTFITPHGYQTNLMVYGPGGYRYKDFFWFGLPLTILNMAVAILVLIVVFT